MPPLLSTLLVSNHVPFTLCGVEAATALGPNAKF